MRKFAINHLLVLILGSAVLNGCTSQPGKTEVKYSFFVAGHTYGNPMDYQYGFHPPFAEAIPFLNDYPTLELGVLTGDVVPKPEPVYWDSALADIKKINVPVRIAPGNHDGGEEFTTRFGDRFHSSVFEDDLFIVLAPEQWKIKGDQLEFLKGSLEQYADSVNNVFVFCHELIWWAPDNEYGGVNINYRPHYPGSINYWDEVHPLLDALSNPVYVFAGDVGCSPNVHAHMFDQQDNVALIASGMGGRVDDNFLIVEVDQGGKASITMYRLGGETPTPDSRLQQFILPEFECNQTSINAP